MESIKPKRSLVEEVYEILVDAICTRQFAAGDRLKQDEIAARLNVSRQPVNSAISILKSEGLVEDTGRRGVVVRPLDPDLYRSIYEYRRVVEPFAVRLAAARMPADGKEEAAKIQQQGREAVASGDMQALLRADKAFHEMIYGWAGNTVVQSSMRTNWTHIRRAMAEVLRDPARAAPIWEEHDAILAALAKGDTDTAADLMIRHIETAYRENLADLFAEPGEA